jgi:hypothetical protein
LLDDVARGGVDVIDKIVNLEFTRPQAGYDQFVAPAHFRIVVDVIEDCLRADALREFGKLGDEIAFEQREVRTSFKKLLAQNPQRVEKELHDGRADPGTT